MVVGTFFQEISDSIGKRQVNTHKQSPYTMAFLSIFWGAILFFLIGVIKADGFIFKAASLPTFTIRATLEILQLYFTIFAVVKADRSTFNFIRTATIPLLFLIDLALGYKIGLWPMIGMTTIIVTLIFLFSSNKIKKIGAGLVTFTAMNAVITISLFKYDITYYNSVAAEQLIIYLILLLFAFLISIIKAKENPLVMLFKKRIFFLQSLTTGVGGVAESFAFNYGAASIIMAAKRSSAIFWSIVSGKKYFKEKYLLTKILIFGLLLIGLVLLAFN